MALPQVLALLPQGVAMLVGDPARLVAMVAGVAFAALLMTQQMGVFLGVMDLTRSTILDAVQAELWVMDPGARELAGAWPLREDDAARVAGVAGVAWAAPIAIRDSLVRLPGGGYEQARLVGLDPALLAGAPQRLEVGTVSDLRHPEAVLVDAWAARGKLAEAGRALAVGDRIEVGGQGLTVAGICTVRRNFHYVPVLYTTRDRLDRCVPTPGTRSAGFVVAGLDAGADPALVAAAITARTGLAAETRAAFADRTWLHVFRTTGIPGNFALAVALGFLVGLAIAGMTFHQFVGDHLGQFAALKTMGARAPTIVAMVLAQSGLASLAGYGIGTGAAALLDRGVQGTDLVSRLTPQLVAATGTAVLAISLLAAAAGGWRAARVDPATVFRN
jgi:putative ABC transport system permease protein